MKNDRISYYDYMNQVNARKIEILEKDLKASIDGKESLTNKLIEIEDKLNKRKQKKNSYSNKYKNIADFAARGFAAGILLGYLLNPENPLLLGSYGSAISLICGGFIELRKDNSKKPDRESYVFYNKVIPAVGIGSILMLGTFMYVVSHRYVISYN